MFETMRRDVQVALRRDPAARSVAEILLCYPGLHAIWGYRLTHWLWTRGARLLARWISHIVRGLTGIEIHPGAQIGSGLFIDHGMGVVIGETAEIGGGVTLYHGVTLGGTSLEKVKRHPTLEDRVVVGAITIGECSRIGANAVVVKPVPPNSVMVGVPGEVVVRSQPRSMKAAPDLEHGVLPDVIGDSLISLMARVEELEGRVDGLHEAVGVPHAPSMGTWRGEDFSI